MLDQKRLRGTYPVLPKPHFETRLAPSRFHRQRHQAALREQPHKPGHKSGIERAFDAVLGDLTRSPLSLHRD
ncbi:hypothetical protein [uncultured Sphingopyxis sp.]|uniref:hypothetical protein n=1 Tax=uncultured Sphingopyxis sp. TaxID=310581 RepID=UPI0025FF8A91|nr:hypothetical protein [uncultured Sphingopyxis sp.]